METPNCCESGMLTAMISDPIGRSARKAITPTPVHPAQSFPSPANPQAPEVTGPDGSMEDKSENLKRALLNLSTAEAQFGFSRASFWRFRKRHRIHLLPGRRVNIDDIIEAFDAERAGLRRPPHPAKARP
jgi:hypothetical protein